MNLIGRVVVCCEFDREGGCLLLFKFDREGLFVVNLIGRVVICCEFDREGGCLL